MLSMNRHLLSKGSCLRARPEILSCLTRKDFAQLDSSPQEARKEARSNVDSETLINPLIVKTKSLK